MTTVEPSEVLRAIGYVAAVLLLLGGSALTAWLLFTWRGIKAELRDDEATDF